MSSNTIRCINCKLPIADKRPVGHINIRPGVLVKLIAGGARLTCQCGAVRVVTVEKVA